MKVVLAVWYYHSPEGRRFLEGRDLRVVLVAVGVIAAYILLRSRPQFSHQEARWRTAGRVLTSAVAAGALWLGVDAVRGEDWIVQLLGSLPGWHENGIRYSLLLVAGWLGWSAAIFEVLRRIAIGRHAKPAEPRAAPDAGRR